MTITMDGVTPSAELRARLAAEGRPVLLAFSRGKDSIAAWLALREAGVHVHAFHMYTVPGLTFVEESSRYFEEVFGQPILQILHPVFYEWLVDEVFQPPERRGVIEAAQLPVYDYEFCYQVAKEHFGLDEDTLVVDGVRACDSPIRRVAIKSHGPLTSTKFHAIWDWQVADVRRCIQESGVKLPVDYELFGRSWDGIDVRFIGPLRERFPADYETVKFWFPLVDIQFLRPTVHQTKATI